MGKMRTRNPEEMEALNHIDGKIANLRRLLFLGRAGLAAGGLIRKNCRKSYSKHKIEFASPSSFSLLLGIIWG